MLSTVDLLRADTRWMLRSVGTRAAFVPALLAGVAAGLGTAHSAAEAVSLGLRAAATAAVFLAPVVVASLWGAADASGLETARQLAGTALLQYRCSLVAAGGVVGAVLCGCSGAVATVLAYLRRDPPAGLVPDPAVGRDATELALTCVAVLALLVVACLNRTRTSAASGALAVVSVHVLVQFSPALPGRLLWKELWPPSGSNLIARSGADYGHDEAAVAAAAFVVLVIGAAVAVGRGRPEPEPPAARMGRAGFRVPSVTRVIGVLAVLTVVLGPGIVRGLPPGLRPSLLLERADQRAPEDVTRQFFEQLQLGNVVRAAEVAVGGRAFVDRLPGYLARPSPRQQFTLEAVTGLERAEVVADLAAGRFHVCLERRSSAWRVAAVQQRVCG